MIPLTTVWVSGWVFVLIRTAFVHFRWNESYKKDLFSSRIDTTRALAQAIAASPSPPQSWVLVSGVGKSWVSQRTMKRLLQAVEIVPVSRNNLARRAKASLWKHALRSRFQEKFTTLLLFCHFDLQPVTSPVRLRSIQRTANGHHLISSPSLWKSGRRRHYFLNMPPKLPNKLSSDQVCVRHWHFRFRENKVLVRTRTSLFKGWETFWLVGQSGFWHLTDGGEEQCYGDPPHGRKVYIMEYLGNVALRRNVSVKHHRLAPSGKLVKCSFFAVACYYYKSKLCKLDLKSPSLHMPGLSNRLRQWLEKHCAVAD